jgi:hypothetical protein
MTVGDVDGIDDGAQLGVSLGEVLGTSLGALEWTALGTELGTSEGRLEGMSLGTMLLGASEGDDDDLLLGVAEGILEGFFEGLLEGSMEGVLVGAEVGTILDGWLLGAMEGRKLGACGFFDALLLLLEADRRFDFFDAALDFLGALVDAFDDLDFWLLESFFEEPDFLVDFEDLLLFWDSTGCSVGACVGNLNGSLSIM